MFKELKIGCNTTFIGCFLHFGMLHIHSTSVENILMVLNGQLIIIITTQCDIMKPSNKLTNQTYNVIGYIESRQFCT